MSTTSNERVYGNRYVISHRIARGGMADVFLAHDRLLDRPVALKVLFPELSIDPNFVERFRREAQNAARLSHPNIVSVYDWGEEDNVYYIVMEYVDGTSLSAMIREDGPLGASRAASIGADVASALSFAHRNGVVHRDVKPGNVLIDSRGLVKVTDFGIARARNATENLTQTGAVMGTATYFSPEQAQGITVDERSDVYSLGVVLYEIVSGKAPFTGDNPVAIAYKHVRESAVSLQDINPNIPVDYEAIVAEAMAKAPANRYQTAEDLRADLVRFLNGQPVRATAFDDADAGATQALPRTRAAAGPQPPRPAPRPPTAPAKRGVAGPILALLSLLTVIAIAAVLLVTTGTFDRGGDEVTVPNVVGATLANAQATLSGEGLNVDVARETSDSVPADSVIRQSPNANATANRGDRVQLVVSSGTAPVTLSSYVGQSGSSAAAALRALGFTVTTTSAPSDTISQNNVISQNPTAGTAARRGQSIALTISSGPQQVEVPDVINATQSTAERQILDAGLRPQTRNEDSDQRAGTVIRTDPSSGTQVDKNSSVSIFVSNGPTNSSSSTTSSTSSTTSTTSRN